MCNGLNQTIYSYNLSDWSFVDEFNFQYSFNHIEKPVNKSYFDITDSGLRINLYGDDRSFKEKSDTYPRSELRGLTRILDEVSYTFSFSFFLFEYISGFDFSLFQVFASSGPNIMFRQRNGFLQIAKLRRKKVFLDSVHTVEEDLLKWTDYRFEFKLSKKGYIVVFRNNYPIIHYFGDTRGRSSYLKLGIYAQQMQPPGLISGYFKNIKLQQSV